MSSECFPPYGFVHSGDFLLVAPHTNFSALEPAIVSAYAQHEREDENDPNYSRSLGFCMYFVKLGPYSSFYSEVMTLIYLTACAAGLPLLSRQWTDGLRSHGIH